MLVNADTGRADHDDVAIVSAESDLANRDPYPEAGRSIPPRSRVKLG